MTNHRYLSVLLAAFLAACATDDSQDKAEPKAAHAEHGKHMFDQLDTDRSGKLSAAELEGAAGPARMLAMHFAEIDADDDGQLAHPEIMAAMEKHHGEGHPDHAAMVEQFDKDGDGELSAAERQAAHRYHFDQADTDDDGKLSASELQAAPGPGPMIAEHLAELDSDGDGALGFDEITAAMEQHHGH